MNKNVIKFETACLAKEKGFNLLCPTAYTKGRTLKTENFVLYYNESLHNSDLICTAPSHLVLRDWIEKRHDIAVIISLNTREMQRQYGLKKYTAYLYSDTKADLPIKGWESNNYNALFEDTIVQALANID